MTRRKYLTLHVTYPKASQFGDALDQLFLEEEFRLVKIIDTCDIALFVDAGDAFGELEAWLAKLERAGVPQECRVVCMRRMTGRLLRHYRDRFVLIKPARSGFQALRERILGHLYLQAPQPRKGSFMVGRSRAMRLLREELLRFAPSDEPVLLWGESGTGKELCARFLHQERGRGSQFSINCSSLKPEMVESELFGHERGAFTGAIEKRSGLLVDAGEGTCFLDEIGEMELKAQASLLRVIEERKVRAIGASKPRPIQCRLVLATHRDLKAEVARKAFREDLFHRIAHLMVKLPTLRDRLEDVPLLVCHFIDAYNQSEGCKVLPPLNFDAFFSATWSGNVRELRGRLQRMLIGQLKGPLDEQRIDREMELQLEQEAASPNPDCKFIPFYIREDHWDDLHDRSRKIFLETHFKRLGSVQGLMAELDLGKSQIYRELKRYAIDTKKRKK